MTKKEDEVERGRKKEEKRKKNTPHILYRLKNN